MHDLAENVTDKMIHHFDMLKTYADEFLRDLVSGADVGEILDGGILIVHHGKRLHNETKGSKIFYHDMTIRLMDACRQFSFKFWEVIEDETEYQIELTDFETFMRFVDAMRNQGAPGEDGVEASSKESEETP